MKRNEKKKGWRKNEYKQKRIRTEKEEETMEMI